MCILQNIVRSLMPTLRLKLHRWSTIPASLNTHGPSEPPAHNQHTEYLRTKSNTVKLNNLSKYISIDYRHVCYYMCVSVKGVYVYTYIWRMLLLTLP